MASPAAAGTGGGGGLPIQMPAEAAETQRRGRAAAKAEKRLNCFVRVLATVELTGNALGTLASLWASIVLIGGYRDSLEHVDFWIATFMILTEAFRVFIRNFKFDSQSLFGSTKALRVRGIGSSSFARMLWRPREGNEVLLIISWFMNFFDPLSLLEEITIARFWPMAVLAIMTRKQLISKTLRLMRQPFGWKQWVLLIILPAVAGLIVPLTLTLVTPLTYPLFAAALLTMLQVATVVLLKLRLKCITTLANHRWGQRMLYLLKLLSILSLGYGSLGGTEFTAVVLLFGSLQGPAVANNLFARGVDRIMNLCFLWSLVLPSPGNISPQDLIFPAVLLIRNLQIPVAVAQIGLSCWRLVVLHGDGPNMKASIAVFYVLALCQGSLYIVACILEFFSFFPRRWLVRRSEFRGKWGAKAVDLYYEHAYTARMEAGVFAEDTNSLASFALDSLSSTTSSSISSSREKQLAGVRVLHSLLLQPRGSRQDIISVITRSEKAVPTLIGMLGWTFEDDRDIRLFAARVTKELSGDLRIAGIPGAVKLVSSLLDAEKQSASTNNEGSRDHDGPLGVHQADTGNRIAGNTGIELVRQGVLPEAGNVNGDNVADNQPQDEESSANGGGRGNASNRPVHDLPILGLEILESLVRDTDNCAEIIKVTNLIPKIIGLTSYSINNESSIDNALMSSSLNLLWRLATTNGKIGATLRQELWESPFLVCNLAAILENSHSCTCSTEVLKPAMNIIAIMTWDEVARRELGSFQVIIHKLVHVFIVGQDGPTNYDPSVRVAAGEALTNLAMGNHENCLAILQERPPGFKLVEDLNDMLGNNEYRCVAASLLQNLCACPSIRDRLRGSEATNRLSSALLVVLKNIETAEGKQLEALIGLASQICYVLPPRCFVQGLESPIFEEQCIKKLVDTLNSNKRPSHEYPRMRRVIVEMIISVLGCYPHYAIVFKTEAMMNALSKAEMSLSKVEKYRVFLENEGVVYERGSPLRDLVARARGLIDPATLTPGGQPNDHVL